MEIRMHKCGTLNLNEIGHKQQIVPRERGEWKKAATHTHPSHVPLRNRRPATSYEYAHTRESGHQL